MPCVKSSRDISLFLAVFFVATLGCHAHEPLETARHASTDSRPPPGAWSLRDLVATDTVQAILADKHLRQTYGAVVGVCADTTKTLAEQFAVPELSTISDSLSSHLQDFNSSGPGAAPVHTGGAQGGAGSLAKRAGLLDLFRPGGGAKAEPEGASSAAGAAAPADAAPGPGGFLGGLLGGGDGGGGGGGGIGGAITGVLGKAASGLVGGLVNMTGPAAAGAGFFGGVGVGEGAAQGLELASANASTTSGKSVAQENNMQATGLNSAIESATMGLTATALRALRQSNALVMPDLGPAAEALGGGLGDGAASGLGLKGDIRAPQPNGSALTGAAGMFAFGMSKSFIQGANVSNLIRQAAGPKGTALTNLVVRFAGPAATGFGKGIGSGAAVGLGLQPDAGAAAGTAGATTVNGSVDVAGIAQDFASGMTSRFLANGTATKAISGLMAGSGGGRGLGNGLDVSRIANGLARGLLAAAGDGAQALGGVNAIISGKAKLQASPPPETQLAFNDSVGGAATGFGQGLGNSAVVTVQKLLVGAAATPAKLKRGTGPSAASRLAPRQAPAGVDLSNLLNPQIVSGAVQKAVDVLGCEGVGGLGLIALGLFRSKAIAVDAIDANTTAFIKELIPRGVITLTKYRNRYDIDGPQLSKALDGSLLEGASGISINGSPLVRFVALLVAHIFFAIVAFGVLLPLAVTMHSSRNILQRLRLEHALPAWTLTATKAIWLVGIAPSIVLVPVFGVLPGPQGAHFQTAHGILGLVMLLVTVAATALYVLASPSPLLARIRWAPPPVVSEGCNQLLLVLAVPTLTTGFDDLSTVSLCLTRVVPLGLAISLGVGLGAMLIIGQAVSGLDAFLQWRARRQSRRGAKGRERADAEVKGHLAK